MTFDCTTLSGIDQATCEHLADKSDYYIYLMELLQFSLVFAVFLFIVYQILYKWVFRL